MTSCELKTVIQSGCSLESQRQELELQLQIRSNGSNSRLRIADLRVSWPFRGVVKQLINSLSVMTNREYVGLRVKCSYDHLGAVISLPEQPVMRPVARWAAQQSERRQLGNE
jgi:hypothetical protein